MTSFYCQTIHKPQTIETEGTQKFKKNSKVVNDVDS